MFYQIIIIFVLIDKAIVVLYIQQFKWAPVTSELFHYN